MTERVFVTGATGFVGATLCRMLVQRGYTLRCLVRPGSPAESLRGLDFERVEGRLADEGVLREALAGVDHVAHLAAVVSFDKRDTALMHEVNVEGTRTLAALARQAGVARFLHFSTVAAVGHATGRQPIDENAPYNFGPLRLAYCDTKHAAELVIQQEVANGLDAVIVNPSSMFGPGDRRKAGEDSLIARVAYRRIPVCPPGGCNFADVRDVVSGSLAALEHGRTGERYILGGQNLTGRELIEKIARVIGVAPPRVTMPGSLAHVVASLATIVEWFHPMKPPVTAQLLRLSPRFMWYSSKKAEDELGYVAYPVEIAIKATCDWMFDVDLLDATRVRGIGRT